jgi:fructan beta-fructosidase
MRLYYALLLLTALLTTDEVMGQSETYKEPYRPQIHFSPKAHWINDPNGMVFFNGTYQLFFQYYPGGTTWGPMHWGHAESKDLIHWKELPVALYPDSLGYIFSGSAVVDKNNTSGFGKNGKIPLVAIFTHHDPKGEKAGRNDFQNQSLAYSLDNGATWTKYQGNPVLKNTGIRDFRDPKVMWYAPEKKWVMTLATLDHITFFSSPDLKRWKQESEFGKKLGAHGGVWECPDLFPLTLNGKTYWVLIVNLNPGGPNGGSATQYFTGDFDGHEFKPIDTITRWVDFGPDEYAGITWSNTGARKIFLGWMSNWNYANQVPTEKWRNAMTIPRELSLKNERGEIRLASMPVKELIAGHKPFKFLKKLKVSTSLNLESRTGKLTSSYIMKFNTSDLTDYEIVLSNPSGDKLLLGYDEKNKAYFVDRSNSGKVDFEKSFKGRFTAPRMTVAKKSDLYLVVDQSSVELFADGGLTSMTAVFFPDSPMNRISIKSRNGVQINELKYYPLESIW